MSVPHEKRHVLTCLNYNTESKLVKVV